MLKPTLFLQGGDAITAAATVYVASAYELLN
jgi:hypothetical protein